MRRAPLTLTTTTPLEDQVGCFGYFGFGSGVAIALYGQANDTGAMYCNRCIRSQACWQRHRARVRVMFPSLVALCDEIAETHKGSDYIAEFMRRTEQSPQAKGTTLHEPFVGVMMGNLRDGAEIATGGDPVQRGADSTLTWPLRSLAATSEAL